MENDNRPENKTGVGLPPGVVRSDKLFDIISKTTIDKKMVSWSGIHIRVRTFLSAREYMDLVHKILDDCVTEDGIVAVELLDFAMRINILSSYAGIELPTEFEALYEIAYKGGLYDTVVHAVNQGQVCSISQALSYYVNMLKHP